MNPREKKILIITIIVALAGGVFVFMPDGVLNGEGLGGGTVGLARDQFRELREHLLFAPATLSSFNELKTQLPETAPGRTPELTFTDEVTKILHEHGWATPTVKPYKRAAIKDVKEYYYIDLELTVPGELGKILELLVDFQKKNILIKEFKLDKTNMDEDKVTLNVKVSRLAKYTEAELKKMAAKGQRRGTGGR